MAHKVFRFAGLPYVVNFSSSPRLRDKNFMAAKNSFCTSDTIQAPPNRQPADPVPSRQIFLGCMPAGSKAIDAQGLIGQLTGLGPAAQTPASCRME